MIKLNAIRLARLRAGMCQHEAALKSGIPQSQISLFERDLKQPNSKPIEALQQAYQIELAECKQKLCQY